jgi:hypothetical protein
MRIEVLIDVKTVLGEGPLWDVDEQRLYFIDSFGCNVFRCTADGREVLPVLGARSVKSGNRPHPSSSYSCLEEHHRKNDDSEDASVDRRGNARNRQRAYNAGETDHPDEHAGNGPLAPVHVDAAKNRRSETQEEMVGALAGRRADILVEIDDRADRA